MKLHIFHLSLPFFPWQIVRTNRVFRPAMLRFVHMGLSILRACVVHNITYQCCIWWFKYSWMVNAWRQFFACNPKTSNFVRRWSVKSCFSFSSAPTGEGVADLCPVACSIHNARSLAGTTYAIKPLKCWFIVKVSWFCWFLGMYQQIGWILWHGPDVCSHQIICFSPCSDLVLNITMWI